MCWEPIDGAILRIVQVVYRWRNSRICAIYYACGVYVDFGKVKMFIPAKKTGFGFGLTSFTGSKRRVYLISWCTHRVFAGEISTSSTFISSTGAIPTAPCKFSAVPGWCAGKKSQETLGFASESFGVETVNVPFNILQPILGHSDLYSSI